MASTQRDVELVIRARDEATKALGTITDALNTLVDSQQRTSSSAAATGTTLDKLGDSLANMTAQAKGLDALQVAATKIETAGAAIERLEGQVTSASERLDASRSKYEAVGEAIDTLRGRSAALKESQAAEGAALKQTQIEIAALTSAMNKLGESFPKTEAGAKKLLTATEQQQFAYRDNLNAMAAYQEKMLGLEAAQERQSAATAAMRKEQSQTDAELKANIKTQANLSNQIERLGEIQTQANGRLVEGKTAFGELETAASRAATILGVAKVSTEGVAAASKSAAETIKLLNAELGRQPKVAVQQPVAVATATPRQELIAAKEAVAQTQAAWQQASNTVAVLNNEIKASIAPTEQQTAQFLLAKNAASEAKNAYEQAGTALSSLRARLQEHIATTNQERVATIEGALAAREMAAARQKLEGSDLYTGQQEEIGALGRLKVEWQELSAAMRQNFTAQAEAISKEKEGTEVNAGAASSISNLKSEVMGLAGAYFGLMGAIQAVKGVIDTYRTLEQAQAQLVASHNGDQNAAASDMIFLRGQAERLGLSLKDVAEQYGKLSVAANQNNITQQTTRQLFTAVAESARMVGLDSEKTTNVLYGFVRMIDFGKVSARDFRSVLTMVPGAAKAMDDALDQSTGKLGVTRDEFRKLEKSAEGIPVTDQLLKAWAANMEKSLGDRLPFALHTFNAEWGRFQTNLQEGENTIGKSGFMDALAFQLHRLNTFMKSDEGMEYFQNIGHALSGLVNIIGFLASHIDLLKNAFELVIAVKFGSFITGMIPVVMNLVTSFRTLTFTIEAFAAGAATAGEVVGAAMGGLPILLGAIAFGLTKLFGDTMEGVTALDSALDEHDRIMTHVQDAYTAAGGSIDKFRTSLQGLTETQLQSNKQDMTKGVRDALAGMNAAIQDYQERWATADANDPLQKIANKLHDMQGAFANGKLSVSQYRDELLKMKMADAQFADSALYKTLSQTLDKVEKGQAGLKDLDAALKAVHGTNQDVTNSTTQLNLALSDLGMAIPDDKLKDFNNSLLELKKNIPELARAAEAQANLEKAREALQSGLGAAGFGGPHADAGKIKEALEAYQQATGAINMGAGFAAAQVSDRGRLADAATGARKSGGLTSRRSNGGDNAEQVVDNKEAYITKKLGVDADTPITQAQLRQFRDLYIHTEGAKGNNVGNLKNVGGSGFQQFDSKDAGYKAIGHQIQLDYNRGQTTVRQLIEGRAVAGGGAQASASRGQSFGSDGAFLNAMLKKLGIEHSDTSAASFSKLGEKVSDAGKAEPGDIVILKGKGNKAGGVGVLTGRDENGDAEVTSTFGKGKAKTRSIAQDQIAAYQRIPDASQMFDAQGAATDQAGEFQQMLKDLIGDNRSKTVAIGKSPVDLAVTEAMDRLKKWLADNKAKADREGKPFTAGFKPGQEQQVASSVRAFFNAKEADEEKKKLDEINHAWGEILHGAAKVTAEERARQALLAKGFKFDGAGKPADATSAQALTTQTAIETNKDMRQSATDLGAQGEQMAGAKKALTAAYKEGDVKEIAAQTAQVKLLSKAIADGLPTVIAYFKAMGDEKTVADLTKLQKKLKDGTDTGITDAKEMNQWLGDGLSQALGKSTQGFAAFIRGTQGITATFRDMRNAFLQFAGDFLLKIAQMIMQAEIMKMLQMVPGGGSGVAGVVNSVVGQHHSGGIAGSTTATRLINPAVFAGALRYHTGGIAGLQPDEVPAILRKGEEVLTEASPRHINNIGKSNANSASPRPQDIKIVNAIDSGHMMSEALGTSRGQKALVNYIRSNARSINTALRG